MPVPAPPQHSRPSCASNAGSPRVSRDPWEEEAETLAGWLAHPGADHIPEIHPVPSDSKRWGAPIDPSFAAHARGHAGHPLDPAIRREFESRFHRDFGDVRIHDDQSARELAHSLGAEAFTLGSDIFTTRSDRSLLAHEIVHTVQQEKAALSEPLRMQASFEKTTTDLDPKVEILLDLHLRSRGKQLKGIAETKLLVADSWWRKLRAKLEEKNRTAPVDAKAEIEAAVKEIRGLASLDTAAGDPIQNGVAGLLADYLRINDAPALAAMIVIEFPYSRTAVPVRAVVGALASEKKRGQRAVLALPRIWKTEKPKGAVAETWTQEITDAVNQFLTLTPLKEHMKQRQKLVDRLKAPLRGESNIPDSATAPTAFDRLTDKSTLTFNELDEFARNALAFLRTLWTTALQNRITASQEQTSNTPFTIWGNDIDRLKYIVDNIETSLRQTMRAESLLPAVLEGHSLLKKELGPAVEAHYSFWASVAQSVKYQTPGEADKYLKLTYGETTYAQLFFAADEGALAVHLQDIVRPLADAVQAYLDLFDTPKLPEWKDRSTVLQIYGRHKERADAFRETLRVTIHPAVIRKIYLARTAGKTELARGLGWFGQWMEEIHGALEKVQELDENSSASVLVDTVATRLAISRVLWKIAAEALGKAEADVSGSTKPEEKGAPAASRRNVPAAAAWQAVMDRTNAALALDDIQTGMLILDSPFQESQRSEIDQLTKDISGNYIVRGLEPFTGSDLATFYVLFYQRAVASELTALSDQATAQEATLKPREKEDLWLVQKATDKIKERSGPDALPKRYASRDVYWYPYAKDDRLGIR